MPIISTWQVSHRGSIFAPGTIIIGLADEEEQGLIEQGLAVKTDNDIEQSLKEGEDEDLYPSPDAFAKLGAGEQKELLEECGLTPGSNTEARIAQYTEWFEQGGDHDGA